MNRPCRRVSPSFRHLWILCASFLTWAAHFKFALFFLFCFDSKWTTNIFPQINGCFALLRVFCRMPLGHAVRMFECVWVDLCLPMSCPALCLFWQLWRNRFACGKKCRRRSPSKPPTARAAPRNCVRSWRRRRGELVLICAAGVEGKRRFFLIVRSSESQRILYVTSCVARKWSVGMPEPDAICIREERESRK